MKVFIASAANLDLEEKYLELARNVSEVFAKNNFDLLFGAGHYSMMGECYKVFTKFKRKVYAYTVPKWERDFLKLPKAKCVKVSDTLLRFRKLYFRSDVIVILPGGIGTLAEFTCAVEEFRSSGGNKRIVFNKHILSNYLLIGMVEAVITLLPITYKIFKLPYDNYKNYNIGLSN